MVGPFILRPNGEILRLVSLVHIHSSKNPFLCATLSYTLLLCHTQRPHSAQRPALQKLKQKAYTFPHTKIKIHTQHNLRTISTLAAYISADRTGRMIEKSGNGKSKAGRVL